MVAYTGQSATFVVFAVAILLNGPLVEAAGSDPPNWQPEITIKVIPDVGKATSYSVSSPRDIRTVDAPAGATLELTFRASNIGGNPGGDGISVDVWLDWPESALPGDEDDANFVCIPEDPADCLSWTKTITANLAFHGKRGKGVYNVVSWVDRFNTVSEDDEANNVLGPVMIRVLPTVAKGKERLTLSPTIRRKLPQSTGEVASDNDRTSTENKSIEAQNAEIERMKKEAAELEAELKALEQGGGG